MVCIAVPASAVELPLPISDIQRNEPIDFASEILPILTTQLPGLSSRKGSRRRTRAGDAREHSQRW